MFVLSGVLPLFTLICFLLFWRAAGGRAAVGRILPIIYVILTTKYAILTAKYMTFSTKYMILAVLEIL